MSKLEIQRILSDKDRPRLPIFDEIDKLMEAVRDRAYKLFEARGFNGGRDLEDWLTAEREICRPAAELIERDDGFELSVALVGFEPREITLTVTPTELILKASHEATKGEEQKKAKVHWTELRKEDVYRRIVLPTEIDVSKVNARFEKGLLVIRAPKAAPVVKAPPKRVEITTYE